MLDHEIDAKLDHLVDTRQMSYTQAYEHLGLKAPAAETVSAEAMGRSTGNIALTGAETFIEEDEIDWTNGLKGPELARAVLRKEIIPEDSEPTEAQVALDHEKLNKTVGPIIDWDTLTVDPNFKPQKQED